MTDIVVGYDGSDCSKQALASAAGERDTRMIVVGTHGQGALRSALIGSTPYKLIHQTDVPVLVVPAGDDA